MTVTNKGVSTIAVNNNTNVVVMSKKLRDTIKLSGLKCRVISHWAKVNYTVFSLLLNRRLCVDYGDQRVTRIAKVLNFPPDEAFETIHID